MGIAALVARVPMATINLITATEQHQIATVGFDAAVCRREDSMCDVTLAAGDPVLVPDARQDPGSATIAGRLSHDLHNPLGAVLMPLRLLDHQLGGGDGIDVEQLRWLATRASSGAARMEAMIEDLLVHARLGGELRREPVDLGRLVADVREDLAAELAGAAVEVGELPTVVGDPVQLHAVLQNLLANAGKFTEPGEPARVEVAARRTAAGWRLCVVDHGVGVRPEDRGRVFEPMVRTHTHVPGAGIGLATVRRVVQAHGGRVGLDETPGGGTSAWVELPD